ncbi:MAG: LysR family transcriptional regulator [Gluconacetobacter diazotrophicus]|nr:LysR family transcriptional regulator [Gluconacetobacter diazotrophicus]
MTRQLPDLEAWAIFATVAARGSFSAAAAELELSNPTVSKALSRLEARLGVSLFTRTSRRLSLTEAGHAALPGATRILAEADRLDAEAVDGGRDPRGPVRVSAPVSFGTAYLAAVIPAFLRAHPFVVLDLALSDRRVDLVAERFDLALRVAAPQDSSLLCRHLCAVRLLPVASPSWLAVHGRPTHPRDLAAHPVLGYSGNAERGAWRFRHPAEGEVVVSPPVRLWSDNADLLLPALLAGDGVALQPEFLVWRALRDGSLEHLLPDWEVPPLVLHLLMPPSPLRPRRVRLVIDHLVRTLAAPPWSAA